MKYQYKYYSGGGTEYDGGIWEKKETDKTILFTQIEKSFYNPNYTKIKVLKNYGKFHDFESAVKDNDDYISIANNGHTIRDWKDGTYTIYPNQCGIPHVMTPIK